MAHLPIPTRRRGRALALALASVAAPAVILAAAPTAAAACTGGEEEDAFTTTCTPFMVPNSPGAITTTAANPDVPEIDNIPLTGANSGTAIGLEEDAAAAGPQPIPESTISSSP
jgi:hypothetical protein